MIGSLIPGAGAISAAMFLHQQGLLDTQQALMAAGALFVAGRLLSWIFSMLTTAVVVGAFAGGGWLWLQGGLPAIPWLA